MRTGSAPVGADVLGGPHVDLEMNSTAKLAAFSLDVESTGALIATTNGTTLLVKACKVEHRGSKKTGGARQSSSAPILDDRIRLGNIRKSISKD